VTLDPGERHVTVTVGSGTDHPASDAERRTISLTTDSRDPLIVLTNFLTLSPPPSEDETLARRWLEAFLGMVDACREKGRALGPLDEEPRQVVCRVPWQESPAVDWIALALDQGCGCLVAGQDEDPLTFVCAVDKRLAHGAAVGAGAPLEPLEPETDKVVIISYAADDQRREVLGEGAAILRGLPAGFLESARQVVANKTRQFTERGLLEQIVPGELLESSPVRSTQRARLEAARVVWLHNAPKRDVLSTLACLPPESGLVIHLLGDAPRHGLAIHEPALGDALRALDLLKDPRWRRRKVKLLYLSFSGAEEPARPLLGAPHSFPRQILRESPRIAATICLRWALPRAVVRMISATFYERYWEEQSLGADPSRSLLEARRQAYARWQGGGGGRDWRYYCAWAAPMLITQDPPAPESLPSETR